MGGYVSVLCPKNSWTNYNFDITEEMLAEVATRYDVDIPARQSGLTQIFYATPSDAGAKGAQLLICTRAGVYNVAFTNWSEYMEIKETGIYLFDFRQIGSDYYAEHFECTVTTGSSGESTAVTTNPAEYRGNEIQVFSRGICIGDSITEGSFDHSQGGVVCKKYSYPSILKRITGIDIVNAGIAGMTSKTWYDASLDSDTQYGRWVNGEWVWNVAPEVSESDVVRTDMDYSNFDFAIIHLGINDIGFMGEATVSEMIASFEANINSIISKLKSSNSGIKVFLATIIPCYATSGNTVYEALNEKIREIANATSDVYLIDLNAYSECFGGTAYENKHLTAIGYRKMASEIASLVSYTISKNLDDFKAVQFIGTPYVI